MGVGRRKTEDRRVDRRRKRLCENKNDRFEMKNIIFYVLQYRNIILDTRKTAFIRKFNLETVLKSSVFTQPRKTEDGERDERCRKLKECRRMSDVRTKK